MRDFLSEVITALQLLNLIFMRIFCLIFLICLIFNFSKAQHECVIDDLNPPSALQGTGCNQIELTLDEILALPDANFKIAFHFKANSIGDNFTCDPNDPIVTSNTFLYAPTLVNAVINEMNTRMSSALLLNGQNTDAKITFSLINGGDCNSIFLYESNESFTVLPDAINIYFINVPNDPGIRAWTTYGSNKMYIENVLEAFLNGSNNFWSIGRVMNHEFGHTRNLLHSFNCNNPCNGIDIVVEDECCGQCWPDDSNSSGCWGCSSQQLIMAYGIQLHFTECEFIQLWNYIVNNPRPYQEFNICEETTGSNEIIFDVNAHVVWNDKKVFNTDVRIKPGTIIEVQCDVLMGNEKRITVEQGAKLIVNGGRISNLCSGQWRGIQVYGGSSDYSVEVINNSTIENTSLPAISMFHQDGWLLGQGNAHVFIDNSVFNNCKRVLAMGALLPSYNTTVVNNTSHNGGKWSITNWNCYNVKITNNEFNNITNECIVTEVGQFQIEGNTFNSGRADILFANVNPGFGSIIDNNQFNGANTGVRALGTTFGQHKVKRNQFWTGQFDLFMDGDNNYLINNNDVTSDFGGVFVDNGNHSNEVFLNQIDGSFVGLMPLGSNGAYLFYENCFNTTFVDNYIEGSIGGVQAKFNSFIEPATNCFTHQGNVNHSVYDMIGNPDPFSYVEPNSVPLNCTNAEKAHPNIIRITTPPGSFELPCGQAGPGNGFATLINYCNPIKSIPDAQLAINWLGNMILEVQNNTNLNDEQKSLYIAFYKRCLKRVKWLWIEVMFEDGRFEEVRDSLNTDGSDDAIIAIYTSYIFENDLDEAQQYLSSLLLSSEQLSDFVTIQLINLQRIRNGNVYEASGLELTTIENIAIKRHPYSGYAKALYYWLTDEIISTELPDVFTGNNLEPRSSILTVTKEEIAIYPNPFNDLLSIISKSNRRANLRIVDLLGRTMYDDNIHGILEINTSQWNSGTYIVTITLDGEIILQDKVLLTY